VVLVRIPASSANLGPGFDCLGLALNLYNYIEIKETDKPLSITLGGKYREGIPQDETNLVYRAATQLWQRADFQPAGISLHLINNIPPARGLGSSSAAIVGGLYAGNLIAGSPFNQAQLLDLAASIEGHPDNVAPALCGGATIAVQEPSGGCLFHSLGNLPGLKMVVAVPSMLLSTYLARSLLPPQVPFTDAVWNLGRTGLLVTALLTQDYSLLKSAMQDKLHEQYRAKAIPGMSEALAAANRAGALGAVLSGAGPTLIAFIPSEADETPVGNALRSAFEHNGVQAELHYLKPDCGGTVQLDEIPAEQLILSGGGTHGSLKAL